MNKILKSLIAVLCLLLCCACLGGPAEGAVADIMDGLYIGDFSMYVETPIQCTMAHNPGYLQLTNNPDGTVTLLNILFFDPETYTVVPHNHPNATPMIIGVKVCDSPGDGAALVCSYEDQVIDFNDYVEGIEALVINTGSPNTGVVLSDTSFKKTHAVQLDTCTDYSPDDGQDDCAVAQSMMGVSGFPCHIGPWKTLFDRIGDVVI